jgi:hypothetical protein
MGLRTEPMSTVVGECFPGPARSPSAGERWAKLCGPRGAMRSPGTILNGHTPKEIQRIPCLLRRGR